jgi:hypothetical protein
VSRGCGEKWREKAYLTISIGFACPTGWPGANPTIFEYNASVVVG